MSTDHHRVLLTVVCLLLLGPGSGAVASPSTPEASWLARAATPDTASIDAILAAVGNARVVLLGEPTHGDGAVFAFKARLIERLWRDKGFGVVAFESGFYDMGQVDAALDHGVPLGAALERGVFGIWSRAAEARPLFELAAASRASERPLRLAGVDPQVTGTGSQDALLAEVEARLATTAEGAEWLASKSGRALALLLPRLVDARSQPPPELAPRDVSRLRKALVEAADRLAAEPARDAFLARALENLVVFLDLEHADPRDSVAAASAQARRDRVMAENLRTLLDGRFAGEKIVVWTASRHALYRPEEILSTRRTPQYPGGAAMGEELRRELGEAVYALGFVAGGGRWGKVWEPPRTLPAPIPGSLEADWLGTDADLAFLDLRRRRDGDAWLHAPTIARPLGYVEMVAAWPRHFDGLVFVREMTPATRVVETVPSSPASPPSPTASRPATAFARRPRPSGNSSPAPGRRAPSPRAR